VTQVLQKLQANTFLQAATMTGMKAQFDLPGFTATVLAPSDAAFATFLHGTVISAWLNHCWVIAELLLDHCWIIAESSLNYCWSIADASIAVG